MPVITTSVPVGLPGTVVSNLNSETGLFNPDLMPTAFGSPVKLVTGLVSAIEEDDTAAVFYGLLVAADAQNSGGAVYNDFGYPAPNAEQLPSVMLIGTAIVACTVGTPVKGGIVYMRVAADTGKLVGDLEATADGSDNVVIPSLSWDVSGKDSGTNATVVRINR